jgi:hypothetical protein
MNMKIVYAVLLALCVFVTCSFDSCIVPPQAGTISGGFPVTTQSQLQDSSGNIIATSPTPGIAVSGTYLSDDSGAAAGSKAPFSVVTDANGNAYVNNGRVYANWNSSVNWYPPCGEQTYMSDYFLNVSPISGIGWLCVTTVVVEGANASTNFVLPSAMPPTLTSYGNFSSANGDPGLRVYVGGTSPSLVTTVPASSVVPGSSATFPFPKQSTGAPLAEGFYSLVNTNAGSGGNVNWVDTSYLAVGGSTTLSSAFGVDAGIYGSSSQVCGGGRNPTCYPPTSTTTSEPVVTQYYSSQVSYLGKTLLVGSYPVAVTLYGAYSHTTTAGHVSTTVSYPPTPSL